MRPRRCYQKELKSKKPDPNANGYPNAQAYLSDCKAFMQKFNEKLTVEETKTEEKPVEKEKTEVEADEKKKGELEKADEEKKTEEASPST
ncbi:unnamed protein product [Brassica oleracea]